LTDIRRHLARRLVAKLRATRVKQNEMAAAMFSVMAAGCGAALQRVKLLDALDDKKKAGTLGCLLSLLFYLFIYLFVYYYHYISEASLTQPIYSEPKK
jgi:hypothetical protein